MCEASLEGRMLGETHAMLMPSARMGSQVSEPHLALRGVPYALYGVNYIVLHVVSPACVAAQ